MGMWTPRRRHDGALDRNLLTRGTMWPTDKISYTAIEIAMGEGSSDIEHV
jgi:hypothetical protein